MLETIIIILMSIVIFTLAIMTLLFKKKYNKMISVITQLVIDKEALLNKVDTMILENSKEANEGFIKFLSDSREAAFVYIEDVQKSIEAHLNAISSGNEDEIVTTRMALFNHLPETEDPTKEN